MLTQAQPNTWFTAESPHPCTGHPPRNHLPWKWGMRLAIVLFLAVAQPVADAQQIILHPKPASGPLDNPLKGWCSYAYPGQIKQPYSMVFFYASWKELEPVEGHYAFEKWEKKAWDIKEADGKHLVFRVYLEYPSLESGVPDWLKAKGVTMTPYDDHGGGSSPDYNNEDLVSGLEKLIAAMGDRYNQHPRIAFIEAGLLGHWGEWHTWPKTELYANEKTEQRVVDAYRSAFPDKQIMVREARGYAGQQDWLGYHDDYFPEDTLLDRWGFHAKMKQSGRTENWRKAAIGGEMIPYDAKKWMGPEFKQTLAAAEKTHFSWVGPYSPALEESGDEAFLENSQALVRRMGYEYELAEVKLSGFRAVGEEFSIEISGKNNGLAPFYYPWPIQIGLLDTDGRVVESQTMDWDIRDWQPGEFSEKGTLVWKSDPSPHRIVMGVIDPWKNQPAIRFANKLPTHEGWTILSIDEITEAVDTEKVLNLISDMKPHEDLLEHRSGFGRNVTGGEGGEVVVIDKLDFATFQKALADDKPRWIRFKPGLAGSIELDGHLYIGSNKTIDGRGADITITSPDDCDEVRFWGKDEDWKDVDERRNLIVHNLKIMKVGKGDNCGQGLGIAFGAKDIWIDHVTFKGNGDESLSMGKGATNLTVSWCRFIDTDKAILLSWGDGEEDALLDPAMRATIHHNQFLRVNGRSPALRFGRVHFFNNSLKHWNWSGVNATMGGEIYSENNVYGGGRWDNSPPALVSKANQWAPQPGFIKTVGDRFKDAKGIQHSDPSVKQDGSKQDDVKQGHVFDPREQYEYEAESASDALVNRLERSTGWSSKPCWPGPSDTE